MPVGPTQPYRLMAEKINYRQISLKNVRFFFMDEYVDDEKDEPWAGISRTFRAARSRWA